VKRGKEGKNMQRQTYRKEESERIIKRERKEERKYFIMKTCLNKSWSYHLRK
jgi:hypothetical protein